MLVPLAASLVSSFLLWSLLWFAVRFRTIEKPPFLANYRVFLGFFWLTAPLAWLYAIPYERFLDAVGAVEANYSTLGLVAAWRVLLMIRVAQVWLGLTARGASILLLWYGCTVLLLAIIFAPWPVVDFMSGARDPAARAESNIRINVLLLTMLAWPVLTLLLFIQAAKGKARSLASWLKAPPIVQPLSKGVWGFAALSLLVWVPVMAITQPPLYHKPTPYEQRQIDRDRIRREREAEIEQIRREEESEAQRRANQPANSR